MGITVAELDIKLKADTGNVKRELNDVDKGLKNVGSSATSATGATGGFMGSMKGAGAGLMGLINPVGLAVAGVGLLSAGLMSAVDAAKAEEVGIARLNENLKNNIAGWDGNTAAIEAHIAKQEKLSFADDELRDSLGKLVGQTKDLAAAQNLQTLAMDLARSKNISLEQATQALIKADQGSYGALKKLGIEIHKTESATQAFDKVRAASANSAEAYANTAAGAQERLGNTMSNVMEDIGGAVIPIFTSALQGAVTVLEFLTSTAGTVMGVMKAWGENIINFLKPAIDGITGAWQGLMTILQPGIDAVKGLIDGIMGTFGLFFTNMEEGRDFFESFGMLFSNLGDTIGHFVDDVIKWLGDALPKIQKQLGEWGEAFWKWIQKDALPGLMTALGKLGEAVWAWITGGGLTGLISNLATWGGAILGFIAKDVLPFLGQKLLDLGTFIWNWITGGGLTALISNLGTWAGAFLGWIAKDVLPFIGQKLLDLGTAIWNWITNDAAPKMVEKVKEFATAFWTWITSVRDGIGAKLAEVWTGFTTWVGTTVTGIGTEVAKFVTAFWTWITTTVTNIPTEMGKVWTGITTWVSDTVKKIPTEAAKIGTAMLDGIVSGIGNLGKSLWDFISKVAKDIWDGLVSFFTGQPTPTAPAVPGAPTPPPSPPPTSGYGPRANGGPVWAGGAYMVGERGPEMFVPKMSGNIIPNGALGGDTFNVVVNAGVGADANHIAQTVVRAMSKELSMRQRLKGARQT